MRDGPESFKRLSIDEKEIYQNFDGTYIVSLNLLNIMISTEKTS